MPFDVDAAIKAGATEDQILNYLRPMAKGYNVDLALKSGATRRQVIDYLASTSGANAELAAKSGVFDVPGDKGWWEGKSDQDKQIALDTAGEIVGGTAGAILGGAAGAPGGPVGATVGSSLGAGAGATVGKGAARLAGRAIGLETPPQSAADTALDYGITFGAGALGEGLGRAAMAAGNVAKTATRNAARRALLSKDGREIADLAGQQGVPVRAAMVSKPVSLAEQALERFPFARSVVQKAKQGAQQAWEVNLDDIARRLSETPADDVATGRALQRRLEANQAAARKHYRKEYGQISNAIGKHEVDLSAVKNKAMELDASMPEGLWNYFPQGTVSKIKRAARIGEVAESQPMAAAATAGGAPVDASYMAELNAISRAQTRGKSYTQLSETERASVLSMARRSGAVPPDFTPGVEATPPAGKPSAPEGPRVPQSISFDEATELRTQLLEAERAIRIAQARGNAPAFDTRAISGLRESLDKAVELSLRDRPQALAKWREVNKQYRETARAIRPGSGIRDQGNPMAREIETEVYPERLPTQATASATPFAETQRAVGTPPHVPAPTDVPDPVPILRRNYAERLTGSARTQDPMIGEDRYINPRALERAMEKAKAKGGEEILGPEAWRKYQESLRVGKASNPRDINTSGTTLGTETVREFRGIGRATTAFGSGLTAGAGITATAVGGGIPGAAAITAGLIAPRLAAKGITNPRLAQFILADLEKIGFRPGGPVSGVVGRTITHSTQPRLYSVVDPNGEVHTFRSRGSAEAFKKNAKIR